LGLETELGWMQWVGGVRFEASQKEFLEQNKQNKQKKQKKLKKLNRQGTPP